MLDIGTASGSAVELRVVYGSKPGVACMMDLRGQLTEALADRYRIERKLGQGGWAAVYLAEDVDRHRKVAVKALLPTLAELLGPERFAQEIRITSKLQHPHILPLYDSGEADGVLYYVMPYVNGQSLRDLLDHELRLSVDESLRILERVAHALEYAHGEGLIHRDIKPENILLQDGEPLLADFGIALAVSAVGVERLTQTGITVGTPDYMSPEQAVGAGIDGRSDVYALGCVAYEMLAGRPPFRADTSEEMMVLQVRQSPPWLRNSRPDVPRHIAWAIEKALAKSPSHRFASPSEFCRALEGTARFRSWSQLRSRPIKLIGVAALVVIIALVWWFAVR
jgi:serine/threonine protein kinase